MGHNLSGSDWQMEKQGHWTRSSTVAMYSFYNLKSEEVNRTNKGLRRKSRLI